MPQIVNRYTNTFDNGVNKYAFKNTENLKKVVKKVIDFDKSNPRKYNPKWIVMHGMDVYTKDKIAFEPQAKWQDIDIKTRDDYYKDFKKYVK